MEKTIIQSINIKNFKVLKNINLKNLKRLNIIYGGFNIGKTTLLETIYLSILQKNTDFLTVIRDFSSPFSNITDEFWDILFYGFDTTKPIKINIEFGNSKTLKMEIFKPFYLKEYKNIDTYILEKSLPSSIYIKWEFEDLYREKLFDIGNKNFFEANFGFSQDLNSRTKFLSIIFSKGNLTENIKPIFFFVSSGNYDLDFLEIVYGNIVKKNFKRKLVETLKTIDSSIEDIDMITFAGRNKIGIKIKGNKIYPLNAMGEGFSKIFTILSILIDKSDGILLIDEIENGLYWKIQGSFCRYLEEFAEKFNVQVFATTHSYEFLENIVNNLKDTNNIAGIRLKKKGDEIIPIVLAGEDFTELIKNRFEVR